MKTITAIEGQKRDPRRVNIYLDGSFAFGVTSIAAAWLKVGQELTEEKITSLQSEDAREKTYLKALHFLSYRPRSSEELRRNLSKRGCDEKLIEETLSRLRENGLINDPEFAHTWVENRTAFRPRSKSILRMELRQKGISEEIIQPALDEIMDDSLLAFESARKQSHRYSHMEWLEFRQKLGGFLARRGFSYSIVAPVISQTWKDIQDEKSGRKKKSRNN